jgi:hypothetical protein
MHQLRSAVGGFMLSRMFSHPRFLVFYSASVTVAFAVAAWLSFLAPVHGASKAADFDRITVHRIDVVEPDGTPRLIISDRAEYPGSFFHRREIERPDRRDAAGMLFINDEGTEDGGLIYGGESKAGARSSFSHLSFDQYEQDQTVARVPPCTRMATRRPGSHSMTCLTGRSLLSSITRQCG